MSIEAMVWAKRTPTGSPTRRLVLYVLADYADEHGTCWPAVTTIAAQTELSERTVRRALADLEEALLVTRITRVRHDGSQTTNRYRLSLSAGPAPVAARPCQGDTPSPDTESGHEPSVEPSVEPPALKTSGTAAPPADRTLFEVPTLVEELCSELAEAIGRFRDGSNGGRPAVTKRWRDDMRLLLDRGPLGDEAPQALTAEKVRGCIAYVFTELAEPQGNGTFCWAAQVQSPQALRRHWWKIRTAAIAHRDRTLTGSKAAALTRHVERETGVQAAPLAEVIAAARAGTLDQLYPADRALGAGA